jgi:hypothetical protein
VPPSPFMLGPGRDPVLTLCDNEGACLDRKEVEGGDLEVCETPPEEVKSVALRVS